MAGVGVALRNQAYEIADIPLLDLMNALGAPVGNDVAPQETGYSSTGPDLRNVFANERLDQIIHAVDDHAAVVFSLLPDRGHRAELQRSFALGPWPSAG